jgi:CHASE2 domain-containing sensor protein
MIRPKSIPGACRWAMACVLLGLLCSWIPPFRALDLQGLDQAFRLQRAARAGAPETHEVVIVGLDEASVRELPEPLALYHRHLGRFLEAMAEAGPRAVGLDLVLPEHSWDGLMPGSDLALMRGIGTLRRTAPLVLGRTAGTLGRPRPIHAPLETVAGPDSLGFVQVPADPDQVVRRFETRLGEGPAPLPTLAGRLAQASGHAPRPGYIDYGLGAPFAYVPFRQVLDWHDRGRTDRLRAAFGGRTVLLGSVIPFEDRVLLPVRLAGWEDPALRDSPGVLLQAQILRTLLADAILVPVPAGALALLAVLGAAGGLVLARRPLRGALALPPLHGLLVLAAWILMGHRVLLPVTGILAALDLGFLARLSVGLYREHLKQRELERELAWARVLEETNRRLAETQEKLARALASPPDLLENIPGWAEAMGWDLQRSLGLADLCILELRPGELGLVKAPITLEVPSPAQVVAALASGRLGEALLVPARGLSGEVQAVLLVVGDLEAATAMRLLESFASQLGNALEMRQLRGRLARAEATGAATLEELQARGVETLKVCPRCGLCAGHRMQWCEADGTELEVPGILPLHFLERYRMTRRLGVGGMGAVYEARDGQLGREVAIKVVRPELFHDMTARLRFEREIRTLVQVSHPNVVTVFDSGEVGDGSQFLIMERLRGMDLATLLRRYGPGRPPQIASLVLQCGLALDAAHRLGIIHRDIKPQNLFLVPQGDGFQVKILDFGIATSGVADGRLTQTGLMLGTPAYMAPERILGSVADERSDLHALATVVYEALLGPTAQAGEVLSQVIQRVLFEPVPPPTQLVPWMGADVDAAFAAALAKDPLDRPPEVLPWARDLAGLLETVRGVGPGWPEPMQEPGGSEGTHSAWEGTTRSLRRAVTVVG